jgi:peptidoglycan/xylan/chitin deacetylase (PgdA/CDA1 family)
MASKITRRKAVSLLAQSLLVTPIVAAASKAQGSNAVNAALDDTNLKGGQPSAPVYVVLWFDTEDYILPASDDAAKRIANFLTSQGIRATFKIVGEKARFLEGRQRRDVINALSLHEIGYHSNTHSQHPTPAEYESVLDWEQGVEEFDRRERSGFDDLGRIFGKWPTCYGQPGASWAPQSYRTLKEWGVHVYLDDGDHVQLEGKPFWYGGLLNIFHIDAGRQLRENREWSNLEETKAKFDVLYAQMSAQQPGGLVSFMFHPTQFVSNMFWDVKNFLLGANPGPSEWKEEAEKSPVEREQAFKYLEGLVRYMKSFPGIYFITASEAYALYMDSAQGRAFDAPEIADIANRVNSEITFQVQNNFALSASELFALLNGFVHQFARGRTIKAVRLNGAPYGPSSVPNPEAVPEGSIEIAWDQFSRTAIDVNEILARRQQIPNVVWFGSRPVTPESYLLALADVTRTLISKGQPPASVTILPAELAAGKWVAKDSPSVWHWRPFPKDFHSAHLMELARLQTWTIKPAVLSS